MKILEKLFGPTVPSWQILEQVGYIRDIICRWNIVNEESIKIDGKAQHALTVHVKQDNNVLVQKGELTPAS